jgi:hypothetical protein
MSDVKSVEQTFANQVISIPTLRATRMAKI